jgi:hypothetical protein
LGSRITEEDEMAGVRKSDERRGKKARADVGAGQAGHLGRNIVFAGRKAGKWEAIRKSQGEAAKLAWQRRGGERQTGSQGKGGHGQLEARRESSQNFELLHTTPLSKQTMAKVTLLEPRLKFLKESAHLLAFTSPATSAVLGSEHDRLLQSEELDLQASKKDWDAHRRQMCGACGNLMIPGWSCYVFHESLRPTQRKKNAGTKDLPKAEKSIVYQCLRCHRKTVQTMPTRPPRHVKLSSEPSKTEAPSVVVVKESRRKDGHVAKSVNASSKQRAKARKQSGLQAMLAKSKTQSSGGSGFGLDLTDLMQ